MKKIYLVIVIILLLIQAQAVKSESVNLYGFTPASVDSLPPFQPHQKPWQSKESVLITILIKIDKKGEVKSLAPQFEKDSLYLAYVESYVRKLSFQPAMLNNKKINSVLPIKIEFNKKINSPLFSVPLFQDSLIEGKKLFEYACELNDIDLPQIIYFPSYFSDINLMDSINRYPFIIEKLSYKDGNLVQLENVMSSHNSFLQQLESAILYCDIELPRIKGKEISTDLFLMISFFPQLSYPVAPYDGNNPDSSNLLHQNRLRIVNNITHFLSEPIPKRLPSNLLPRNIFGNNISEQIEIFIRIDTLGKAQVFRSASSHPKKNKLIRELVSKLKFYPAINQKNELTEFTGYIRIDPFDELNVRISYLWLE